jgi:hypothetical protein
MHGRSVAAQGLADPEFCLDRPSRNGRQVIIAASGVETSLRNYKLLN